MFRRRSPGNRESGGVLAAICPKCGCPEVIGDSCPRCRVKVSTYRIHLATLHEGALIPRARARKRGWFKKLFAIVPGGPPGAPTDRRSSYEQLILTRIYRELVYPATARGVYVVLLGFDLTTAGRASGVRLTVHPANPEISASVRTAFNRAQPFPLPPSEGPGSENQRISLALTVNI